MKKILGLSSVILLFAIILIAGISGCGSDINSNTDKKIKVTIPFDLSEKTLQKSYPSNSPNSQGGEVFYGPAPSNVRSIRVDAVYPDGSKISNMAEVSTGTYVEIYMEVNEGSNVYFKAFAYDGSASTGNLLYTGISSPQSLIMGMYYDIIIQMSANTGTTGTATPTVSSVSPAPGATGVPPSGIITIIFSKPMDPSTITASTITGLMAPVINTTGSTVTLSPTPWYSNTTYTVTITTGVKDLAGNPMSSPYSWSFTTGTDGGGGGGGGGGGTSLPSAFSYSLPLNGTTGVSLTPTLSWADSVGETSYTIEIATATGIVHSATVGANIINYTVSTGLSPLTTYYWKVKAVNSYGATLVSNAPFTFTTTSSGGGGGGSAPTAFNLSSPSSGTTGISLTPTLSWTNSTGETSYSIQIATNTAFTAIAHSASAGSDITSYTIPSGILSSSTDYWWRVGALNSYGSISASNAPFAFRTGVGGGGDTTPPTVSSVTPSGTSVPIGSVITIIFSEAMDPTSINTGTIMISPSGTGITPSLSISYSGTTATVTQSGLSSNTPYIVTIKAGVKDAAGNVMASDSTWSFTTGSS